jgi:endoglucanase
MSAVRTRDGVVALVIAAGGLSCAHVVPLYRPAEVCSEDEAAGVADAPAALIEDAENGGNQIVVHDGRNGFVYTFVDQDSDLTGGATLAGYRPSPILGGANGSRCAWNMRGKLSDGRLAFVGLGMNMLDRKRAYDASGFTGVSFFARRGPGSSAVVRVHLTDWNTDPDGHLCRQCYNDFGANIVVTEAWTKYTLPFETLAQLPGWGDPRPPRLDAARLFGIQFRVMQRGEPFDIWIDDVAFIEAPPSAAPPSAAPPSAAPPSAAPPSAAPPPAPSPPPG